MDWYYEQPVKILFGRGKINDLGTVTEKLNVKRGMLIAGAHLVKNGLAKKLVDESNGKLAAVFSDVSPNPDVSQVDECAKIIRKQKIDYIVAFGGGSIIDCAKAASVTALTGKSVRTYHGTGVSLPDGHLPLIAIPTTAGTGTEVTAVSVLTDRENGKKIPIASKGLYPVYALIDSELTVTMPQKVTAETGLDVLCHAIEAYWSVGHQPITDILAIHAAKLVFDYLPRAYENPEDITAREKMCAASLLAGLAFNIPKTTASHACSFPLTNIYGIPHGEACALTLDYFLKINAETDEEGRLNVLAEAIGFADALGLADGILALKKRVNLRVNLYDFGLKKEQIAELVKLSKHPNLKNNPVEITDEMLWKMYEKLST